MADSRLTPGRVLQEADPALERGQGRFDAPVGGLDPVGVVVELLQEVPQDPPAVRVEFEAQRIAERAELLAHMPAQPRQDGLPRRTGNEAFDDATTVDAGGDPAEDAADADAVPVQDLLDANLLLRALFDQRTAIPAQPAQVAEGLRQNQARAGEAELADAGQPDAVRDVGLAMLDLLDVLCMDDHDVDPSVGQNIVGLLPVDAGGLHDGAGHPQAEQPLHEKGEAARQCAELARLDMRRPSLRPTADRRGDLHLVHVEPRGGGMPNVHVIAFRC